MCVSLKKTIFAASKNRRGCTNLNEQQIFVSMCFAQQLFQGANCSDASSVHQMETIYIGTRYIYMYIHIYGAFGVWWLSEGVEN